LETTRERRTALANRNRLAELLRVYGELLTDKQARFATLYARDGLTFASIARQENVSRQAVHDAVRHAEKLLEFYELKLGICSDRAAKGGTFGEQIVTRISVLKTRIARQGIIYSHDWILGELTEIQKLASD
jgi:predicted DNA-binding protein YlxM (UPF0122 family)